MPPPSGIPQLADALEQHRDGLDLADRRLRSRRQMALGELIAEHGESALRALGGRREAERLLGDQDPNLGVAGLVAVLRDRARQPTT